jgi:hypothetical protein
MSTRELALDAEETRPQIENQVITLVVERPRHTDACLDRRRDDLRFGEQSTLIRASPAEGRETRFRCAATRLRNARA